MLKKKSTTHRLPDKIPLELDGCTIDGDVCVCVCVRAPHARRVAADRFPPAITCNRIICIREKTKIACFTLVLFG